MATSLTRSSPALSVIDGIVTTLSTHVAAYFGKRHDDVIKAIRALLAQLAPEHARNFAEMFIDVAIGNGATRQSPAYRLTRDGFTLLAMGFTGKRALQFKLAYIDAFNRMEADLRQQQAPALPAPIENPIPRVQAQVALACANQVAQGMQRAVFDCLLSDGPDWKHSRWVVSFVTDSKLASPPVVERLGPEVVVGTWAEIADILRHRPSSVPRELVMGLAEAATRAAFSTAANLPRGPGEEIAEVIREAGNELSLADLQTIASGAAMEVWHRVHAHSAGTAGTPKSRVRSLLKP